MKAAGNAGVSKLMSLVKAALNGKLDKSGGTLTGNLTGQYLTGTWLQTTAATDLGNTPSKIAVLDGSGWVYYRTPAELKSDIGAGSGTDVSTVLQSVYPIGAIYLSTSSTNPKTLFGFGTWAQIKDTFLLAAGSTYKAGATGGEATHMLTTAEIPSHYHDEYLGNDGGSDSAPSGYSGWPSVNYTSSKTWWGKGAKTSTAGGGAAHNNMPPYLAVYMWKRTA